jgi:hypothetical protein
VDHVRTKFLEEGPQASNGPEAQAGALAGGVNRDTQGLGPRCQCAGALQADHRNAMARPAVLPQEVEDDVLEPAAIQG